MPQPLTLMQCFKVSESILKHFTHEYLIETLELYGGLVALELDMC